MKMMTRIGMATGGVLLIIAVLGTVKGLQIARMIEQGENVVQPPQTVTAVTVQQTEWERTLSAIGSLEAAQGMMVSAELSGKVAQLAFTPGSLVEAGQLLLQQDISEERAQLQAAQSRARLTARNLERAKQLKKDQVVTESLLDDRQAEYDQAAAEVERIRAVIAKKTIRAPFAGRLGIRLVDLGEVLEPGQPIVSLQSMDPIYANFELPQRKAGYIQDGLAVRAHMTTKEGDVVTGRITAFNPDVNPETRNLRVQATLANGGELLRPGMFVRVEVLLPEQQPVLSIPATAVLHAPYSDSVFIVDPAVDETTQQPPVLRQQFVQLGERRGDFVAVVSGLEPGQTVVSTGVFKLRNGMPVVVNNRLSPDFDLNPQPDNA